MDGVFGVLVRVGVLLGVLVRVAVRVGVIIVAVLVGVGDEVAVEVPVGASDGVAVRPQREVTAQGLSVAASCALDGWIAGIEVLNGSESVFRSRSEPTVEIQNVVDMAA